MRHPTALLLIAIIGSLVPAQTIDLHGKVTDQSNRPVVGAAVELVDRRLRAATDTNGDYSITNTSRAADFRSGAPLCEKVRLAHGRVCISLSEPSLVAIELFDGSGHSLLRLPQRRLPAGDYRFDLAKSRFAAQLIVVRVSIGGHTSTFRSFPFPHLRRATATSAAVPGGNEGFVKATLGFGMLRFSGLGYKSKEIPVTSYSGEVNAVLDSLQPFGLFRLVIEADKQMATFLGRVHDGPIPPTESFREVMKSGPCRLYKRVITVCEPSCGNNATCVDDNTCLSYPNPISVGTVTVNGLKMGNADTVNVFSIKPTSFYYLPDQNNQLHYPPCNAGDPVTVTASGNGSVRPFTLRATGVGPLVVPQDTIELIDGRPATVTWVPAAKPGDAMITINVNLTLETGTKGYIGCDCEDNGSLILPATLLDSLKAFGLSAWPLIEIYRRSTSAVNAAAGAHLIIESVVQKWEVKIPGIISCLGPGRCPEGMTCGPDQLCR